VESDKNLIAAEKAELELTAQGLEKLQNSKGNELRTELRLQRIQR